MTRCPSQAAFITPTCTSTTTMTDLLPPRIVANALSSDKLRSGLFDKLAAME
jgi:hypothetical protein